MSLFVSLLATVIAILLNKRMDQDIILQKSEDSSGCPMFVTQGLCHYLCFNSLFKNAYICLNCLSQCNGHFVVHLHDLTSLVLKKQVR